MKSKQAIIIGYSGHAYSVIDCAQICRYEFLGYLDLEPKSLNPYHLAYKGSEVNMDSSITGANAFLGLGDNQIRQTVFNRIESRFNFPFLIHPKAVISKTSKIQKGAFVYAGSIINAFAQIGIGSICNTGSIVEHECVLGDFVHVAPGAVLAGHVTVGNRTYIGANAVIKQGLKIGEDVIIGAGSVVLRDVPNGSIVYGNPARQK